MRLGALEAGGTKMVCAVGNESGEILDRISLPTETPDITMPKMIGYFEKNEIEALGIGCFGPVDLNRNSETYGYIKKRPRPHLLYSRRRQGSDAGSRRSRTADRRLLFPGAVLASHNRQRRTGSTTYLLYDEKPYAIPDAVGRTVPHPLSASHRHLQLPLQPGKTPDTL